MTNMVKIKVYKCSYTTGKKNKTDTALWKTLWQWVKNLKMSTPYNLAIPLQGLYILEKLLYMNKKRMQRYLKRHCL